MSSSQNKRQIVESSSSAADSSAAWSCSLCPSSHTESFPNWQAFEQHHLIHHTYICTECSRNSGNDRTFPSQWLLECHLIQFHSEYTQTRHSRNLPSLPCIQDGCPALFFDPGPRKAHAINTHGFPSAFYFDVVEHGIGGLLDRHGLGASLIVPCPLESRLPPPAELRTEPGSANGHTVVGSRKRARSVDSERDHDGSSMDQHVSTELRAPSPTNDTDSHSAMEREGAPSIDRTQAVRYSKARSDREEVTVALSEQLESLSMIPKVLTSRRHQRAGKVTSPN